MGLIQVAVPLRAASWRPRPCSPQPLARRASAAPSFQDHSSLNALWCAAQCKVWNTNTGEELLTLEGHKNVTIQATRCLINRAPDVCLGSSDGLLVISRSSTRSLLTIRSATRS